MQAKAKNFSAGKLVKWIVLGLLLIGTVLAYVFHTQIFGADAVFNKEVSSNDVINTLYHKIPALIKSVQIVTIAYLVSIIIRSLLKLCLAHTKRGATIVTLVNSFIKYATAIVALLMVLAAWGVDTGTLLAGAGIKADRSPNAEARTEEYYKKRPCPELVYSAAEVLETLLREHGAM